MLSEFEHVWNASNLYQEGNNEMTAFCYEKARAEAAVTCCLLTG